MKNKKLLVLLAEYLSDLDASQYQMTDHAKGPLGYAAKLKPFRDAGWRMAMNDNDYPVGVKQAQYKGYYDCTAAAAFFDISVIEAEYLFSNFETDIRGYSHPPLHASQRKDLKNLRDQEPPSLTASRIRIFISHPGQDFLGREEAERA